MTTNVPIERLTVSAYTVPTDYPEADGTIGWQSTTMVFVEIEAGGKRGMGFSYADRAAGVFLESVLKPCVEGRDAMAINGIRVGMARAVRNNGRPGIAAMAISAVDVALWDVKARILDLPLVTLLGATRPGVPVYGSGGFTSYTPEKLGEQLGSWAEMGIGSVKMKVGTHPSEDPHRVRAAREAIGPVVELFVDANGAYSPRQALSLARTFAEYGVAWFEEPVTSDDLAGLRFVRERGPVGMDITAGEYGYDPWYFRRMLEAGAIDVLMADATRCGGITGFLEAGVLCDAYAVPLSAHTSPSIHLHVCCAVPRVRHLEYFHDHVRIERLFFEGAVTPTKGIIYPDLSRPGLGLELKQADARKFAL